MDHQDMQNEYSSSYQTGHTQMPKSHRGIITFLLVLVIFLCGISTALGLVNIHLFRQLKDSLSKDDPALSFNHSQTQDASQDTDPVSFQPLGLSGETVSAFWQEYQNLPCGIYITEVTDRAVHAGLQPGDILLRFGSSPTENVQALTRLLEDCQSGEVAQLVIYRDGQEKTVSVTIESAP